MQFNTQIDKRWSFQIMTECKIPNWEDKTWKDIIKRWGCLSTVIANIIQFFSNHEFTPKDMNDLLKQTKSYYYLHNTNCREEEASLILWSKLQSYLLKTFIISLYTKTNDYKEKENILYAGRIIHPLTKKGHWINVLKKFKETFWCFDVEDGLIKQFKHSEITWLHEFIFRGD